MAELESAIQVRPRSRRRVAPARERRTRRTAAPDPSGPRPPPERRSLAARHPSNRELWKHCSERRRPEINRHVLAHHSSTARTLVQYRPGSNSPRRIIRLITSDGRRRSRRWRHRPPVAPATAAIPRGAATARPPLARARSARPRSPRLGSARPQPCRRRRREAPNPEPRAARRRSRRPTAILRAAPDALARAPGGSHRVGDWPTRKSDPAGRRRGRSRRRRARDATRPRALPSPAGRRDHELC